MTPSSDPIGAYLSRFYREEEYPVLAAQFEEWGLTRPLAGLKILDGTPVFRNTTAKYRALLSAGAELTVASSPGIPHDERVLQKLEEFGIPCITREKVEDRFDLVLDCAGCYADLSPRLGFVELTRSGVEKYKNSRLPVFMADSGRIKIIETMLGTGEGFLRAMRQCGHGVWRGRSVVVFGYGKVGSGIVMYALREGAPVTVVDAESRREALPTGVAFVDMYDLEGIDRLVRSAYCAVSATGRAGALGESLNAETLRNSPILLANMGVEDEFGPGIPAERVLNAKRPLNFILEDPTRMSFIETTMALHNAGAVELARGNCPAGISVPGSALESRLLSLLKERGCIQADLVMAGL